MSLFTCPNHVTSRDRMTPRDLASSWTEVLDKVSSVARVLQREELTTMTSLNTITTNYLHQAYLSINVFHLVFSITKKKEQKSFGNIF